MECRERPEEARIEEAEDGAHQRANKPGEYAGTVLGQFLVDVVQLVNLLERVHFLVDAVQLVEQAALLRRWNLVEADPPIAGAFGPEAKHQVTDAAQQWRRLQEYEPPVAGGDRPNQPDQADADLTS